MRAMPAIAVNVFRESVRDKVLYNLVAFAILLMGASYLIGQLRPRGDDRAPEAAAWWPTHAPHLIGRERSCACGNCSAWHVLGLLRKSSFPVNGLAEHRSGDAEGPRPTPILAGAG